MHHGSAPPDGWMAWDAYGACCRFYVADKQAWPLPIAWRPCDATAPSSIDCQQMAIESVSAERAYYDPANDRVVLQVQEQVPWGELVFLADLDGPVHHAIGISNAPKACRLRGSSSQDRFVYSVYEPLPRPFNTSIATASGMIGGAWDEVSPAFHQRYPNPEHQFHAVGDAAILDIGVLRAWNTGEEIDRLSPIVVPDEGVFVGDVMFWPEAPSVRVWTKNEGARDLMTLSGSEATQLGSDGVDLVWVEADAKDGSASLMRSAFTTDPQSLKPVRVRAIPTSKPHAFPDMAVGCGYVAFNVFDSSGVASVEIVQLSGGRKWSLANTPDASWQWGWPIALTCSDLVVSVALSIHAPVTVVARVRLDSIGPGEPTRSPP